MNDMRLSEKLHLLRWQHKLSMQDISDRTGLAKSHLSNVERGKSEPGVGVIVTLAHVFGVSVGDMLNDVDLSEYDRAADAADGRKRGER